MVGRLLTISGVLGVSVGFLYSQWQGAIENAQVIAGVVQYPHGNPFYELSTKGWNIFAEMATVLLLIGVRESWISMLLSAICGMLAFQAISVFIYAVSEAFWCALWSPFVIFFIHGTYTHGANYAIGMIGTSSVYGMASISYQILVIGLIACQRVNTGLLLLGFAPAIHPTSGAWCFLIVLISLLICKHKFTFDNLRCWSLGTVGTGMSLLLWQGLLENVR